MGFADLAQCKQGEIALQQRTIALEHKCWVSRTQPNLWREAIVLPATSH
ncbi:MAG: hypothetical protein KME42_25000 [Tildeniella nuda ZEHNDER 1965/U140]|nr:hypothetical protein [Tildeniella nuda ZEHNDER 1965/U140]